MGDADFRELVRRMRAKQAECFASRDRTVLSESKDLERRVDAALRDDRPQTGDLFAEGD